MEKGTVTITWLGHSTFILQTPEGKKILVDPWLAGNPKCPAAHHQASADGILVTHGHLDHIGDLLPAQERSTGPIVGIFELTSWLGGKGAAQDRLVGMNKGGSVKLDELDISVMMTDARHSSSWTSEDGQITYLGEAAGFVVTFSNGTKVYLAGDTSIHSDMSLIGELDAPDVAVLPIGDHFTMGPRHAAHACRLLGVEAVVPCHYGTFPLLTGTVEAFYRELRALNLTAADKLLAMEPGQSIEL